MHVSPLLLSLLLLLSAGAGADAAVWDDSVVAPLSQLQQQILDKAQKLKAQYLRQNHAAELQAKMATQLGKIELQRARQAVAAVAETLHSSGVGVVGGVGSLSEAVVSSTGQAPSGFHHVASSGDHVRIVQMGDAVTGGKWERSDRTGGKWEHSEWIGGKWVRSESTGSRRSSSHRSFWGVPALVGAVLGGVALLLLLVAGAFLLARRVARGRRQGHHALLSDSDLSVQCDPIQPVSG